MHKDIFPLCGSTHLGPNFCFGFLVIEEHECPKLLVIVLQFWKLQITITMEDHDEDDIGAVQLMIHDMHLGSFCLPSFGVWSTTTTQRQCHLKYLLGFGLIEACLGAIDEDIMFWQYWLIESIVMFSLILSCGAICGYYATEILCLVLVEYADVISRVRLPELNYIIRVGQEDDSQFR